MRWQSSVHVDPCESGTLMRCSCSCRLLGADHRSMCESTLTICHQCKRRVHSRVLSVDVNVVHDAAVQWPLQLPDFMFRVLTVGPPKHVGIEMF